MKVPVVVEGCELKDVLVLDNLQIRSVIESQVDQCQQQNDIGSFLIYDLGSVVSKYKTWMFVLPNIMPSYVVGCNANPTVLKTLSMMGARFSCANKNEIDRVIEAGINASRVMFTNPVKQSSHIKYCGKIGLSLMAFDSEMELKKIKAHAPKAELVLQVSAGGIEENSTSEMEWKRGCNVKSVHHLLKTAHELGLNVTGISAELGRSTSHCASAGPVLERVVKILREAYDTAVELGLNVKFIDLGNIMQDWSVEDDCNIVEISKSLQTELSCNFPRSLGVQLIGQVDRYFISESVTLITSIIAKRPLMQPSSSLNAGNDDHPGSDKPKLCYYLNDGVYGAFSRLLCDQIRLNPTPLREDEDMALISSSLMGPTCDDLDCIVPVCLLPELAVGDWLIFNNMGGMSAVSNNQSDVSYYVIDKSHWSKLYSTTALDDDKVINSECCSASWDCHVHVPHHDEDSDNNNNSGYEWLDI